MTTTVEIPVTAQPQTFRITIGGLAYRFRLSWCDPAACWLLDIASDAGVTLVGGIALVTGADLVEQLRYLGFNFGLAAYTDHDADTVPTFTNLGTTSHLIAAVA